MNQDSFIDDSNNILKKTFVFLGGKGGVGKTSLATSLGIFAASKGIDTLIISTDPAHSLSDALDQEIGGEEVQVRGFENLFALEIDTNVATQEYASLLNLEGSNELFEMFLGEDEDLSSMTPPGTDESMAFAKVLEFIESPAHDLIIFDTAPTGHTLRLLSLPDVMDTWLFKIMTLPKKLGSLLGGFKSLFGGGGEKDNTQTSLKELQNRVKVAKQVLSNPEKTEFIPVTIPTLMSFWETDRLITALKEFKIASKKIIINQINPENESCKYCKKRHDHQKQLISDFKDLYEENYKIKEVEMLVNELRGTETLSTLSYLWE